MIALLKMVEQQMARVIFGQFILLVWMTSKVEILEGAKPNVKLEGKFLDCADFVGRLYDLQITFVCCYCLPSNFVNDKVKSDGAESENLEGRVEIWGGGMICPPWLR